MVKFKIVLPVVLVLVFFLFLSGCVDKIDSSNVTETPTITPKTAEKSKLWNYYPNKTHEIWIAENYRDYIIPENKIVKEFSDSVYLYQTDSMGTYLIPGYKILDKEFVRFIYVADSDSLFAEANQPVEIDSFGNRDFWLNPDYYVYNGFKGDCEDYVLLWASVFEDWNIHYMIVGGYLNKQRDWWIEFIYDNERYIGQVEIGMIRIDKIQQEYNFRPVQMFSKRLPIQKYNDSYLE